MGVNEHFIFRKAKRSPTVTFPFGISCNDPNFRTIFKTSPRSCRRSQPRRWRESAFPSFLVCDASAR